MKYWTIGTLFLAQAALAHGDSIEACKEHFYLGVPPSFNAKHENREEARFVCKEYKGTSFYALSYNHERRAADWVAYRLGVDKLGPNTCRTKSRQAWQKFFGMCSKSKSGELNCRDVFFSDNDLEEQGLENLLPSNPYSGTRFDRGHQAPAAAIAWHGCGWFLSFSTANISPQAKNLNRESWKELEEAARYWAVTKGVLFVVTGPIYLNIDRELPWFKGKDKSKRIDHLEHPGLEMVRNKADIPTASYKVFVEPNSAASIAFVIANGSEILPWREMAVDVSLVERLTNLEFSLPANQDERPSDLAEWPEPPPGGWMSRGCEDGSEPFATEEIKGKEGRAVCRG